MHCFLSKLLKKVAKFSHWQDRKLVCKRYVRAPINLAQARHRLGRGSGAAGAGFFSREGSHDDQNENRFALEVGRCHGTVL